MTRRGHRRTRDYDDIDIAQSRAFERGEHDTPRIRELEEKAFRTRDARVAARRELDEMGDVMLVAHVRREGAGFVAYLPHLRIRGDGPTREDAELELHRAFEEKVAIDPIGALEGIRTTLREPSTIPFRLQLQPPSA